MVRPETSDNCLSPDSPVAVERRFEEFVGNLLRGGVLLSATLVLIGAAVYLARNGDAAPHYHAFRGEPVELRMVTGIVRRSLDLSGRGLIQLGLLLLIATPVARVVVAWAEFLRQRDWVFVVIASIILAVLAYSLMGQ
jgi:uncharacterized membrane protein